MFQYLNTIIYHELGAKFSNKIISNAIESTSRPFTQNLVIKFRIHI